MPTKAHPSTHLYTCIVMANGISRANRQPDAWRQVAFRRTVRAERPTAAAAQCAAAIWALCDADITVVSVYVGGQNRTNAPNRLAPLQLRRAAPQIDNPTF